MERLGSCLADLAKVGGLLLASASSAFERAVLGFVFSFLQLDIRSIDTQLRGNVTASQQALSLPDLSTSRSHHAKAFMTLILADLGRTLPWKGEPNISILCRERLLSEKGGIQPSRGFKRVACRRPILT
jgi:hypothetical protein